jgi:DNA-binding response OmpR family regulator
MQVFIWETNLMQKQNLQQVFESEHHKVQVCSGYQDLRAKLRKHMHTSSLLVVNTNALSSLRQIYHLHRYTPYLSILALCPQQDSPSHLAVLNAGADAYLPQPFTAEILLAHARTLHRHSTRLLKAKLEKRTTLESLADFTFDFSQYEVYHKNTEIPLKKREFLLFHYLLKHTESIHSRTKLHPIIWPGKTHTEGRQIDNLIVTLRKKLPGDVVEIHSYYGEGYQLKVLP